MRHVPAFLSLMVRMGGLSCLRSAPHRVCVGRGLTPDILLFGALRLLWSRCSFFVELLLFQSLCSSPCRRRAQVRDSEGNEVQFRIKKKTQLKKLMDAYCGRMGTSVGSTFYWLHALSITAGAQPFCVPRCCLGGIPHVIRPVLPHPVRAAAALSGVTVTHHACGRWSAFCPFPGGEDGVDGRWRGGSPHGH